MFLRDKRILPKYIIYLLFGIIKNNLGYIIMILLYSAFVKAIAITTL